MKSESQTTGAGSSLRRTLVWGASFASYPLGGLIAVTAIGRVDTPGAALVGGAIVGLVVGTGQALASSGTLKLWRWAPATTLGMAVGLAAGSAVVGYATGLEQLALQGAVTGVVLGVAQALALPSLRRRARLVWVPATAVVYAAGWTVTTLAGVGVDSQFATFGATGALVATALTGLMIRGTRRLGRKPSASDTGSSAPLLMAVAS